MTPDKVRLAPIGLGRWAEVLAQGARRGSVIELHNCFARSADKRRAFREQHEVARAAGSLDELLADPELEGVLVTTPNDIHREVIVAAAEAGKAVYTDKPIAHTLEDAAAIRGAVGRAGVPFAVGHHARRLSGHRVMKQWIDDGKLGHVSLAEANFSTGRGIGLTPDAWRWHADRSPGGALIQLGVHHTDTLQHLLGPVTAVTAHARRLATPSEVPDTVMAVLEFENGALGYLGSAWASPGVYQMRLQGTEANLMYDLESGHWNETDQTDRWSTLVSQRHRDAGRRPVELPPTDAVREQLEEFALAIRGEARIEVGSEEAIRALAVVQAALMSSEQQGRAIEVSAVLEGGGLAG